MPAETARKSNGQTSLETSILVSSLQNAVKFTFLHGRVLPAPQVTFLLYEDGRLAFVLVRLVVIVRSMLAPHGLEENAFIMSLWLTALPARLRGPGGVGASVGLGGGEMPGPAVSIAAAKCQSGWRLLDDAVGRWRADSRGE